MVCPHRSRLQILLSKNKIRVEVITAIEVCRTERASMLDSGNGGRVLNHDQRGNKENATAKNLPVLNLRNSLNDSFDLRKLADPRNPTREPPHHSQSQVDKNRCSRNALQQIQHPAYDHAQRQSPRRALSPVDALTRKDQTLNPHTPPPHRDHELPS